MLGVPAREPLQTVAAEESLAVIFAERRYVDPTRIGCE
jgi:hypothetical protein